MLWGDYMILYRNVTEDEYKAIINNVPILYSLNYNGMNFFKFGEHAKMYYRYLGQIIMKCDIPDELISEMDFVNFYPYKNFEVGVPLPEYIIEKSSFDTKYIQEINPSIKESSKYYNGIREGKLYDAFLKDMYKQWKNITDDYSNNKYGFYDYIVNYFDDKDIDNVLMSYSDELSKKKLIRKK